MAGALLPSPAPPFGRRKEALPTPVRDQNVIAQHLLPHVNPNHILISGEPKATPTGKHPPPTHARSRNPDTHGHAYVQAPLNHSHRTINPHPFRLRTHPPIRGYIYSHIHPRIYTRNPPTFNPTHSQSPLLQVHSLPTHHPTNTSACTHTLDLTYAPSPMSLTPTRVVFLLNLLPPPRCKLPV